MTEEEAQAWMTRLTRIWSCSNVRWKWQDGHYYFSLDLPGGLVFSSIVGVSFISGQEEPVSLSIHFPQMEPSISLTWERYTGQFNVFIAGEEDQEENDYFKPLGSSHPPHVQAFVDNYKPMFRRACFLSSVEMEATAPGKASWLAGLTNEEAEAWNLKL